MQYFFSNPQVAVPVVAIIAFFLYRAYKTRSNNELKQSMVERGMSVEEIERVLNAGTGKAGKE
ncbi:hypothetical protein ACFL6U_11740 [Planctomycetota bacterium]